MNIIDIKGEIGWETTSDEVINKLKNMSGDIEVGINSVGGSVYQGIAIFNALFEYNKGKITTVNKGMAASMASYILMAGDTIKAYSNATSMVHNALSPAYGNAKELRKTADRLDALSEIIANMYVDKTGKSLVEIKQMMGDETFLYGEEMLKQGFVDEIISVEKNTSKEEARLNYENEFKACLSSSKEHCKINGYNGDLEEALNTLATMPSNEKIVNQNLGEDMQVSKEEFDAIKSKYDALEASNKDVTADLAEMTAKLSEETAKVKKLEESINNAEVIAFCGANREVVNYAKEQEFLAANATLQDVMNFAMEFEENKASVNLHTEDNTTNSESEYIAEAIAKQNKGEL